MSDSSSDDDDDVKKLLDSVDTQFINDDMFARKKDKVVRKQEVTTVDVEKPKSLRHSEDTAEQSSLLNVAPEVQKFIAKHLSRICDKQLEEQTSKKHKPAGVRKEQDDHSGIRLFKTSTDYVHLEESDEDKVKIFNTKNRHQSFKRNKRKANEEQNRLSEEEDEDMKAKMAAVSPEWVLNKEGIRGWVRTIKSKVIDGQQSTNCKNYHTSGIVNGEVKKKKKKKKKKKVPDSVTEIMNVNNNSS